MERCKNISRSTRNGATWKDSRDTRTCYSRFTLYSALRGKGRRRVHFKGHAYVNEVAGKILEKRYILPNFAGIWVKSQGGVLSLKFLLNNFL